jgi:hypothetical protein
MTSDNGSDKVRFDGLVDLKAQLVPGGHRIGGALFALGAAAYAEEGVHGSM